MPGWKYICSAGYARAGRFVVAPFQQKSQPEQDLLPTHAAPEAPALQQRCRHEILNRTQCIVAAEVLFWLIVDAQEFAQEIDAGMAVANAVMTDQQ